MAVTTNTLQPEQELILNKKFKEYEGGTRVNFKKEITVGGKQMYMVAIPDGRGFAVPGDYLDTATGEVAADAGENVDGPVLDFFVAHADMEDPMAINFFSAYFNSFGAADLSFIESIMEGLTLPVGQAWTPKQTAQIAEEFYTTFSETGVDPLVTAALAKPEPAPVPVKPPVAKPVVAQVKAAPAAVATAAPAVPSTKTAAPRVDAKSWDAQHVDALRTAGALMPLYAEFPDSFDAVLAEAVKMLKAADKVR